jgi:hypothetical protein
MSTMNERDHRAGERHDRTKASKLEHHEAQRIRATALGTSRTLRASHRRELTAEHLEYQQLRRTAMKRLLLVAPALIFAVACTQQPAPNPPSPTPLGTINLGFGDIASSQAMLVDESQLVFTRTASTIITDVKRNTRYISGTFTVTNNTGSTLNNLTLYALNKPGNLGGTAIKNLQNFSGSSLTDSDYARAAQPGHKMNPGTGTAATVDGSSANLQLFTTTEASAVTGLLPGGTGTILEYGYRMNEDTVAAGGTGTFTVSYRLPVTSSNTDATSFVATFAVAKDGPPRVSQSVEEMVFSTNARTSVTKTEVVYLGPGGEDTDLTTTNLNAAVTLKLRLANPKTAAGATPAYLLSSYVYTSFFEANGNTPDQNAGAFTYNYVYGTGAACIPAACATVGTSRAVPEPNTVASTSTGVANGGQTIVSVPMADLVQQNLSKYKKVKIFVAVTSTATTSPTFQITPTSGTNLQYSLNYMGPNFYTLDLTTPNCAPTCTPTTITASLSSVEQVELNVFQSAAANPTKIELGTVEFFDYQP